MQKSGGLLASEGKPGACARLGLGVGVGVGLGLGLWLWLWLGLGLEGRLGACARYLHGKWRPGAP